MSEFQNWGAVELSEIARRMNKIFKLSGISGSDKIALALMVRRLVALVPEIMATNDNQPTAIEAIDHLAASNERLMEETAKLHRKIDELLASQKMKTKPKRKNKRA